MTDRITFDVDDDGYETEQVDEVVLSGAMVHLEMSSHCSGYMTVRNTERDVFLRLYAQPTSRDERRRILGQEQDRLSDHLRSLLPWGGSMWSIPVHRRPASAVRSWWEARRYAGVALLVQVEDDTGEAESGVTLACARGEHSDDCDHRCTCTCHSPATEDAAS